MTQPFVIAYHLIWTAYGTWLPNDPRGSGSNEIHSDVLAALGELHHGRKRIQPPSSSVQRFYQQAEQVLSYPLLTFHKEAREEIGQAFAQVIEEQRYTCYACAIMPDHVHLLIRKHKHSAEEMIVRLQDGSRTQLVIKDFRADYHPTWTSGHGWIVFLDHPDDICRTRDYINRNPGALELD